MNTKVLILMLLSLYIFAGNDYAGSLEELKSLPYLAWSPNTAGKKSGVVKYNSSKAFNGYNLYGDLDKNIYLIDMRGQVIHRWTFKNPMGMLEHARLLGDGSIIACFYRVSLVKLDKDSRLIWRVPIAANHDVGLMADGTLLIPVFDHPVIYKNRSVTFDSIFHLSKDGKILDKWSTFEHLKELQRLHPPSLLDNDKIPESKMDKGFDPGYQYYHLNSIQVLPATILGLKDKRFQKGNWLICFRNVSLICILDKDTHQIVWSWGPSILDFPHMPRILNNGNILIFDNGGHRSYSRLLIIDPLSGNIVWEYKANPPENFYSKEGGSSQHLANGNFLICECDKGRVFEITPKGKIVWEFFNPKVDKGKRKEIYRMVRISKEEVSSWLKR